MMEGGSIAHQIAIGLGAAVPSDTPVFIRTVAATGADPLLGIRGTETVTDVLMVPRPSIDCVGLKEIALSNGRLVDGDLTMIASAYQVLNEAMVIVYSNEEYRVIAASPVRIGGRAVGYSATLRKRVRTD